MYQTINNSIAHKPWIPASAGTSFTKHWTLTKVPSKTLKKSNYKGENMTNHTLNAQPNTLLNITSGLKGFRANANTILKKDSDTFYKSLSYTPLHLLE